MTASAGPTGFKPVRHLAGGEIRATQVGASGFNGIATGDTSAIYIGAPVKWTTNGVLTRAAAGDSIAGIFAGCQFKDSAGKVKNGYWPGTSGATEIVAYAWLDPNIVFEAQGSATIAATATNDHMDFTGTSGSTYTHQSSASLDASSIAGSSAHAQFRIVGVNNAPDNAWGDTYTVVEVVIAEHQLAPTAANAL